MKNIPSHFEKIDVFIEKMLYYYDICGLVVGIGNQDGLLYTKAAGYKDIRSGDAAEPHHIFHMASLTKLFVSTAILQLCDRKLLNLDEKMVAYLPWFTMADERFQQITILDLLSHTAGMPDCKDYEWNHPRFDEDALKDYLLSIHDRHLLWEPGSKQFAYSNIGYEVLGAVIAAVSGMSFEQYVDAHIFKPLSMSHSTLLTFKRDKSDMCSPHFKNEDKQFEVCEFYPYNRAHAPSSTLTSNVYDLALFAGAHMGGEQAARILGEAFANASDKTNSVFNRRFDPIALVPNNGEQIGLGWFIRTQNNLMLYGHEGMDDGFRSSFWICPKANLFITVTANSDNSPVKKLNKQIFDLLITTPE